MTTTLTYGRKKPSTGDRGSTFFGNLEDNITLDDAHSHDGNDSVKVTTKNLTRSTVAVTNSGWSSSGVMYRKLVTLTTGWTLGACDVRFFLNGGTLTKNEIFPTCEWVTSGTFYLYMPVNDQAVDVLLT